MAQYISKDALLAEIDRRICTHIVMQRKPEMSDLQEELQNKIDCLKSLKGFINNTLEVKEVNWEKERMEECPYRQVGCTMYEGKILECRGACSWVVDYPKLKELKAQKGK